MMPHPLVRLMRLPMIGAGLLLCAHAQHKDVERPAEWKQLAMGGRFMDRFEPMPLLGQRVADTWGVDAVKPRDVLNGMEEDDWSYWGGNILKDEAGLFHLYICRWPENAPKGHMSWHDSEVVRAASKNRLGPFKPVEVMGPGHNPEAYRLKDGSVVCYVIDAFFLGQDLDGPWARKEFQFDARDRKVIAGLSNLSFCPREDGSHLMVNRGGGMWISRDGVSTWEQVTQGSQYPDVGGRKHFEDPVLWRTNIQYHMIVNNWHGRIAYHLRSKDGFHWKVDPGEAYAPGIARSEDGEADDWFKYERMKVFLDEHRRAVQANFAVIDFNKWEDKPNDIHSSKNISIPLTPGRLLTLLNPDRVTGETMEVKVRIGAEPGFDPHRDIDLKSLRFGAPQEVDFGRGAPLLRSEADGGDMIAVFHGRHCKFEDHNFAGKLLGRTDGARLLFGYCRLPWVDYEEPKLTVRRPVVALGNGGHITLKLEVQNHGLRASQPSKVVIEARNMPTLELPCPALEAYGKTSLEAVLPAPYKPGGMHDLWILTNLGMQQPTTFVARKLELP